MEITEAILVFYIADIGLEDHRTALLFQTQQQHLKTPVGCDRLSQLYLLPLIYFAFVISPFYPLAIDQGLPHEHRVAQAGVQDPKSPHRLPRVCAALSGFQTALHVPTHCHTSG